MKQIPLTQGKVAIVDDCDYEYLMQWKWCAIKQRATYYAQRKIWQSGIGYVTVLMHRTIAERAGMNVDSLEVDHRDASGLNNQRDNLRPATRSNNSVNRPMNCNNKSGFKGVSWHKRAGKWVAQICGAAQRYYLGLYDDKIEAAKAYNVKALELFGEFAYLNPV